MRGNQTEIKQSADAVGRFDRGGDGRHKPGFLVVEDSHAHPNRAWALVLFPGRRRYLRAELINLFFDRICRGGFVESPLIGEPENLVILVQDND